MRPPGRGLPPESDCPLRIFRAAQTVAAPAQLWYPIGTLTRYLDCTIAISFAEICRSFVRVSEGTRTPDRLDHNQEPTS